MSQENVDLVHRGVEAYRSGDWQSWLDGFDPRSNGLRCLASGPTHLRTSLASSHPREHLVADWDEEEKSRRDHRVVLATP